MQSNHLSTATRTLLALATFSLASTADAADVLFAGGEDGIVHFQSDGTTEIPVDAGFYFELGTFAGGFDPYGNPTDQWKANWSPVTDSLGDPVPSATVEFTSQSTIFGSYPGFTSTVSLEHNNSPFNAGSQGYIWGFDTRDVPGAAQWILITNLDTWKYPTKDLGFTSTWDFASADPADTLIGTLNNRSITLGDVTIPSPVPEPSATGFALLAVALTAARRRRNR